MKNSLNLNNMGVSALNEKQMEEIVGGGWSLGKLLSVIGAAIAAVAAAIELSGSN